MKRFFSLALMVLLAIGAVQAGTAAVQADQLEVNCGEKVTIKATPKTGYHFVKWSDGNTDSVRVISPVSDLNYTAFFAINQYTILFVNYDASELQREVLDHGAPVSYKGETPTRPATAQHTFTFAGWSPNVSYTALGDAVYVAQYDTTVTKYTITFLNWDSTVLQQSLWDYGAIPSYSGTEPYREGHQFTGWNPNITQVTKDTTYVAQFNDPSQSYTITAIPNPAEGGTVSGGGTYSFGADVTLTATAAGCYQFVRWNDGDTNPTRTVKVTGNATYEAIFEKLKFKITVQSEDDAKGTATVELYVEPTNP